MNDGKPPKRLNILGITLMRTTFSLALLGCLLSGCANQRYIGTLSRHGTYVNRGYGIVLPMGPISERWWIFDPKHPDQGPSGLAPQYVNSRLDLDGDGLLKLDEKTVRYQPSIRLITRDAPLAKIEVDVRILSAPNLRKASLRQLMAYEIGKIAESNDATQTALRAIETHRITFERKMMVASVVNATNEQAHRVALVDQTAFAAEEGVSRRQLIILTLHAKTLEPAMTEDFDHLLHNILASSKAGPQTRQERW
ncbi:MAG: hypothetical protein KTR25_05635 [Myxococcales bacterium]|nr:hypothetical protein [Myxococcales bacterium]